MTILNDSCVRLQLCHPSDKKSTVHIKAGFAFNSSRQHIARSFTQILHFRQGIWLCGKSLPLEHSATPMQYIALTFGTVPRIFLDISQFHFARPIIADCHIVRSSHFKLNHNLKLFLFLKLTCLIVFLQQQNNNNNNPLYNAKGQKSSFSG